MEGESPTLTLEANSKAYSGPCQTSKKEVFAKVVNGFSFFDYFWKNLDLWKDPEFASEASNDLWKKLHLRYLTGLWIHLCINYFRKTICLLSLINIFHYTSNNTVLCTVKSTSPYVQNICSVTKSLCFLTMCFYRLGLKKT